MDFHLFNVLLFSIALKVLNFLLKEGREEKEEKMKKNLQTRFCYGFPLLIK